MAGYNPFLGGVPVAPMSPGGAAPSGGDTNGASGVVGNGAVGPGRVPMQSTPFTLGALVLASVAVIVAVHIAGVRTHFTVSAGN